MQKKIIAALLAICFVSVASIASAEYFDLPDLEIEDSLGDQKNEPDCDGSKDDSDESTHQGVGAQGSRDHQDPCPQGRPGQPEEDVIRGRSPVVSFIARQGQVQKQGKKQ